MILLLIPIIYLATAVWFWRQFAWRIAHIEARQWGHDDRLDSGNISLALLLGGGQALIWPLTICVLKADALEWFLKEPRSSRRRRELHEREALVAEREARIAALEREVGIK